MNQYLPGHPEYPIGAILNFYEIRTDIHNLVFIAAVVETPAMKQLQRHQLAYTSKYKCKQQPNSNSTK
jgi:hypothetical protein